MTHILKTMEKYDELKGTLSTILNTQLLAKSVNALATQLGYGASSRSTLNRIKNGQGGADAVESLISRINEHLNIDVSALIRMEENINTASEFAKIIKQQKNFNHTDWQFNVVYSFVAHDYSLYSSEFRSFDLKRILLLELNDPRAFFNMLAYFYITSSDLNYYKKKDLPHKKRCAEIIEPLGERLIKKFPSNGLAAGMVYSYSLSDIFNAESPILWSLVETIGSMLRTFASPLDSVDKNECSKLLPGLPERAYWMGKDDDKVLLTWMRQWDDPVSGYYELFVIDKNSKTPVNVASLSFWSDEIMSVFVKSTLNSQMGVYKIEGDTISFEWEKADDDPVQTGNTWTFKSLESSQSLRELDRSITDDALTLEMVRGEGFDFDFAMQPEDVIISSRQLTLLLKDGSKYTVDINFAPFLSKLTPAEPLMVCRQLSDDRVFALWPQIRQSIPLDLFNKSTFAGSS